MILFLDFDGVLHPLDGGFERFTHVPHFERVMRGYPRVEIVISSSWREVHSLQAMRGFFSDDIAVRIIDVTPVITSVMEATSLLGVRQLEIETWLRRNGREHDAWVALDDTPLLFRHDCKNLIAVDPGLAFNGSTEMALRKLFEMGDEARIPSSGPGPARLAEPRYGGKRGRS